MQSVLNFWFDELTPKDWFVKSAKLDQTIRDKFALVHSQIVAGEKWQWREHAEGRLAEVIVLDQFSRNMFRQSPKAFAFDSLALALAQEAVSIGADKQLTEQQRPFLYMPYMHSESLVIHEEALKLFAGTKNFDFEKRHKAIIDQFGRYPHRNEVLGRKTTDEEALWMASNSGF